MTASHSSKRLKKWIVTLVVAFAVALFALPKSAKACGGGSSSGGTYGGGTSGMGGLILLGTAVVGVAVTDVVLGAYDVGKGVSGKPVSKGYAAFETSFAGVQTAAIGVFLTTSDTHIEWTPATAAILALPAVLTIHGIVTLATVDYDTKPREVTPVDPRAVPYGNVPYAPYSPPPPPPPQPETSSTHDVQPEDHMRIRFMPTMIPSGTPGNVSMAPGIAAWGVF